MNTKIKIPFVYQAWVIHNGCYKPRSEFIADTVEVQIPVLDELTLAATIDEDDYYFDGNNLYKPEAPSMANAANTEAGAPVAISLAQWAERVTDIRSSQCPASSHGLATYRQAISNYDTLWTPERIEAEQPFREIVDTERDEVIRSVSESLSEFAVYSGCVVRRSAEPVYIVTTFGLGSNHGGTGLFVESARAAVHSTNRESIIPLSKPKAAHRRAEQVALNRGDDKSVPIRPHAKVRMYLPEAFTFDPFSRDELDKGSISLADYLKHNGGFTSEAGNLIGRTAANLAWRLKNADIETQIRWLQEQDVDPQAIMKAYAGQ